MDVRALVEEAQNAVWNGPNAADAALDSVTEKIAAEVRALRREREDAFHEQADKVWPLLRAENDRLAAERDGWRSVAESLRARDTAAQRVIEAIVRPGPAPEYHRRQILRLAEGWRPLAQALAALCRVYDQQAPRGWS